ncbi:cytochrome p450 [Moniliophthora roreri]|nr:cytochrome p450 [Moniliophthora roreri]
MKLWENLEEITPLPEMLEEDLHTAVVQALLEMGVQNQELKERYGRRVEECLIQDQYQAELEPQRDVRRCYPMLSNVI